MDLEQQRRLIGDGPGVVAQVGPVRGSHFPQDGPALDHDVGEPEGSPDLDELAPRDDDLPAGGKGLQAQQDGGSVVVDDEGVLGAGEGRQEPDEGRVPRAAPAGGEIVLQVGVGCADLADMIAHCRGER